MTESEIPTLAKAAVKFGEGWEAFTTGISTIANITSEAGSWLFQINRITIEAFAKRHFPECYRLLDGEDLRLVRAFLEVESLSNTYSLLGGKGLREGASEIMLEGPDRAAFVADAFGPGRAHDTSYVERQAGWEDGDERWFFINGIATSRPLARLNARRLRELLGKSFAFIHNPTQGPVHDIIESALQKFTNVNTEPVARAFVEIASALLDDEVEKVAIVAHSQGTIVMGDVLDLIYCSISYDNFARTNMNLEEFEEFMRTSHGSVRSFELHDSWKRLENRAALVCEKLELYMFANAASRMCYLDEGGRLPHIESFANEHDIVTRLGSLAQDEFHEEDLVRIHGPLYTRRRYGHLLNAHYLSDLEGTPFRLLPPRGGDTPKCVERSVHQPIHGNPAGKNAKSEQLLDGAAESRFMKLAREHSAQIGGLRASDSQLKPAAE